MIPNLKIPFSLLFVCLFGMGCAVGPNYYSNPPPLVTDPQAIVQAKPCTPLLPDGNLSANLRPGWSKAAPAGMDPLSCGGRMQPYYCALAGCGDLDITALPAESQRGQIWHGVVDVIAGEVTICVQPKQYFGVGSVPCEKQTCAASPGKLVRCVAKLAVDKDRGNGTALLLHIVAKPGTILGQAGFAEIPPWGT